MKGKELYTTVPGQRAVGPPGRRRTGPGRRRPGAASRSGFPVVSVRRGQLEVQPSRVRPAAGRMYSKPYSASVRAHLPAAFRAPHAQTAIAPCELSRYGLTKAKHPLDPPPGGKGDVQIGAHLEAILRDGGIWRRDTPDF